MGGFFIYNILISNCLYMGMPLVCMVYTVIIHLMNANFTLYPKSSELNRSFLRNGLVLFIFSMVFALPSTAQINAYASVTAISGTTLTLANLNQTYHTFNNGDQI